MGHRMMRMEEAGVEMKCSTQRFALFFRLKEYTQPCTLSFNLLRHVNFNCAVSLAAVVAAAMVLLSAREQKSSGSGKQQSELWNKSIQIDYLCCCLACLFSMPALLFIFDAVFRTHRRHHFQTQEEEEKTCTNRRIGVNGNLLCT